MYSGDEVYGDEVTSGLMDEGIDLPNILCGECGEVTQDEHRFHRSCCGHDDVEDIDDRDGVGGRRYAWCSACGSEVVGEMDEDGVVVYDAVGEV